MKRVITFLVVIVVALAGIAPAIEHGGNVVAGAHTIAGRSGASSDTSRGNNCSQPLLHLASYATYQGFYFSQGRELFLKTGTSEVLNLVGLQGLAIWKSSAPRVATVTNNGTVCVKRPGSAAIIARDGKSGRAAVCVVKAYRPRTQRQARNAVLSLKKAYKPGSAWTNEDYYFWQARQCHCYGCVAFAGIASDTAFGTFAPFKRHRSYIRIRAGDHVRMGGTHSVVVLSKKKRSIVVAEGNYAGTMHWGRVITRAQLSHSGFYVETRY